MNAKKMILLLGLAVGVGQDCLAKASAVHRAPEQARPAVPAVGVQYKLGQLWSLINTSNPAQTSNFILASLSGQVMQDVVQTQGAFPDGSVAADRVNFGGVVINRAWIQANQGVQVQLQADPALVNYLVQHNRVSSGKNARDYERILLYFVLKIGAASYRFYLNDPFPGGIQGKVNPARMIIKKWDLDAMYRP